MDSMKSKFISPEITLTLKGIAALEKESLNGYRFSKKFKVRIDNTSHAINKKLYNECSIHNNE